MVGESGSILQGFGLGDAKYTQLQARVEINVQGGYLGHWEESS